MLNVQSWGFEFAMGSVFIAPNKYLITNLKIY